MKKSEQRSEIRPGFPTMKDMIPLRSIHSHWKEKSMCSRVSIPSRFSEQPGGDVAHVSLFELVVLTFILINPNELEGGNDAVDIEAHVDESVDEILVVALVAIVADSTWSALQLPESPLGNALPEDKLTRRVALVPPPPWTSAAPA